MPTMRQCPEPIPQDPQPSGRQADSICSPGASKTAGVAMLESYFEKRARQNKNLLNLTASNSSLSLFSQSREDPLSPSGPVHHISYLQSIKLQMQ